MASTIASDCQLGITNTWAAVAVAAVAAGGPYYCCLQHTTNDDLVMLKSTDGVTWTEQDAANAPTVTADSPYDMTGRIIGNKLAIEYVDSAESDVRVRRFDVSTDTWESADVGAGDVETFNIINNISVAWRSNGDIISQVQANSNQDTSVKVWNGSSWSVATFPLADSIICDTIVDSDDRAWMIFSDTTNNDFTYRSFSSASAYGAVTDFDNTVHTTARIRRSLGVFYNAGGTNRIAVLTRDTGGELDLWYGDTGGTTLANVTSVGAISTSTSPNVTCVAVTAVGTQLHAVWSTANTILRDVSDDLTTPAFGSDTTVLSSLTDSDPIPQWINDGTYYGIIYQDNGNVRVEWINAPPSGGADLEGEFSAASTATAAFAAAVAKPVALTAAGVSSEAIFAAVAKRVAFVSASTSTVTFDALIIKTAAFTSAGTSTAAFAASVAKRVAFTANSTSTAVFVASVSKPVAVTAAGSSTAAFAAVVARRVAVTSAGTSTAVFAAAVAKRVALTAAAVSTASFEAASEGVVTAAFSAAGQSTATFAASVTKRVAVAAVGQSTVTTDARINRAVAVAANATSSVTILAIVDLDGTWTVAAQSTASFAAVTSGLIEGDIEARLNIRPVLSATLVIRPAINATMTIRPVVDALVEVS